MHRVPSKAPGEIVLFTYKSAPEFWLEGEASGAGRLGIFIPCLVVGIPQLVIRKHLAGSVAFTDIAHYTISAQLLRIYARSIPYLALSII